MLKTGEYSGPGVYHPDPTNDIDPPIDFGLGASNTELLRAAKDLGVKYLHGNMSFKSHQPSCFNCGIVHPLEGAVTVVPDGPTNVAYFSTNPDEETYFYNWFYAKNGKFPFYDTYQTYAQVLDHESAQALNHLATGSIYTHTFHISNLHDYGGGRTLTTDWLDAVLAKYSSYYKVPVQNPNWPNLAVHRSPQRPLRRARRGGGRGVRHERQHRHRHLPGPGAVTERGPHGRVHHLRQRGVGPDHPDRQHPGHLHAEPAAVDEGRAGLRGDIPVRHGRRQCLV